MNGAEAGVDGFPLLLASVSPSTSTRSSSSSPTVLPVLEGDSFALNAMLNRDGFPGAWACENIVDPPKPGVDGARNGFDDVDDAEGFC